MSTSNNNRSSIRASYRDSYREQMAALSGGNNGGSGSGSSSSAESMSSGVVGTGRDSSSGQGHARRSSQQLDPASYGVLTGAVGGSFGPFPRSSTYSTNSNTNFPTPRPGAFAHRDSIASSDVGLDLPATPPSLPYDSSSPTPGSDSRDSLYLNRDSMGRPLSGYLPRDYSSISKGGEADYAAGPDAGLLWSKENVEADDILHEPNPEMDKLLYPKWRTWSVAGVVDTASLFILVIVLIGLFGGWPIYVFVIHGGFPSLGDTVPGWSSGGINGSGQVPVIPGFPALVDTDTPSDALKRTGFDGETYNLVFSDEFNKEGRTFWPGDDPYWEAVDLHYWGTKDLEWYDPDAITTRGGNLVITLSEEPIHDMNFRSGMLQSWNKFCFTGGYIEVNLSMPGNANTQGFWPAAWTLGNLGRPAYGATLDGMWPYSYSSCDAGTLPNQTFPNGSYPVAAKSSGSSDYGGELSWLVGQRASACTCKGQDHPGPNVGVGRGAPEIDIIEAQIASNGVDGSASQSIQIAPFDDGYQWKNTTPYIQVWDETKTTQNQWKGTITQESMSLMTVTDKTSFGGLGYSTFGFEYDPGSDGRITWAINASQTWQLNSNAMGPNDQTQIGQRLVAEEPMSIVLNLAISNSFQEPQWGKLTFPGEFLVDYVRVYQKGKPNVGCSPKNFPTADYIARHQEAYTNPNFTTWLSIPNNTYPANSLGVNGCS